MNHFGYRNGWLFAEDVPLMQIAEAVDTPFYCYSTATMERHFRVFQEAFGAGDALICFAVKANSNLAVLRTLADCGAGADVVSGGELARALAVGIPGDRIVYSGVGKMRAEMQAALEAGIYQFNVESEPELRRLSEVAEAMGRTAPVALRINPDVDAGTHRNISTGKAENKFGIPWARAHAAFDLAEALPGVAVKGVDVHIGSQITKLTPFEQAFRKAADLVRELRAQGHGIDRLDLGGGLGIPYVAGETPPPEPAAYAKMIRQVTDELDVRLIFEPGRMIMGNAGILVSQVLYVKEASTKRFAVVDAAMNDLIRPALYQAWHEILPLEEAAPDTARRPYDVVGPVCESTDVFAEDRPLPALEEGTHLAFLSAGAYGAVQASEYNSRPLVPEVLVKGDTYAVVRPRPTYDEMMSRDRMPPWIGPRLKVASGGGA
jgi:diaminopimelate decarboxylase